MKFEFIHCADLHLGCNTDRLEERFDDFFLSFSHVIDYAIKHKIKDILISGDFFHLKVLNSKTLRKAIEILQKAQTEEIKIFVIEGNHDKAFYVDEESWLKFLSDQGYIIKLSSTIEDAKVILKKYQDGSGSIYEGPNYHIIGLSYLGGGTEKYLSSFAQSLSKSSKPSVLMLHAAVDRLSGQDMADINKEVLMSLKGKVDYVALGHIHNRYEYDNFLFNPGSLENIRLRDGEFPEKKGFYHVEIVDGVVNAKHIESHKRKVYVKRFDASTYINPNDFVQTIIDTPFAFEAKSSVVIQIYGKVNYNALTIDTKLISEQLKKRYDLLIIEVVNTVNIIKSSKEGETIEVDIQSLVRNEVINSISFNYPDYLEKEVLADKMLSLAADISEGRDFVDIISSLTKGGETK